MAKPSISSSLPKTQSHTHTFIVKNTPKVLAYGHAQFDSLWAVDDAHRMGLVTEGAGDL